MTGETTLEIEELASKLAALGLRDDQAEVYLRLLENGPAKVSALTPHVDSSRATVYRLLDDLCDRGIASKSPDRPTVYRAEDPARLFETELRDLDAQRDRVVSLQDSLLEPLERLKARDGVETGHHWKRLRGTQRIYKATRSIAAGAEQAILLASNHAVTLAFDRPQVQAAWRLGVERVKDGVQARILLGVEGDPGDHVPPWIPDQRTEIRRLEVDRTVHFLVVDETELVVWAEPDRRSDASEDATALWTDTDGIVDPHVLLFEALWRNADPRS